MVGNTTNAIGSNVNWATSTAVSLIFTVVAYPVDIVQGLMGIKKNGESDFAVNLLAIRRLRFVTETFARAGRAHRLRRRNRWVAFALETKGAPYWLRAYFFIIDHHDRHAASGCNAYWFVHPDLELTTRFCCSESANNCECRLHCPVLVPAEPAPEA